MKKKGIKSNLFIFLIIASIVGFYYYFFNKNKGSIAVGENDQVSFSATEDMQKGVTKFKDVQYKTTDVKNRDFITKGREASFSKDKPNLIKLKIVHSFTNLKDGSILNIKSEKANYYKSTKNITYFGNVVITNLNKKITSDIANFISNKNLIKLENNVVMRDPQNTIKGDIALLDTTTNNLEILMKKQKDKVYGKRQDSKK